MSLQIFDRAEWRASVSREPSGDAPSGQYTLRVVAAARLGASKLTERLQLHLQICTRLLLPSAIDLCSKELHVSARGLVCTWAPSSLTAEPVACSYSRCLKLTGFLDRQPHGSKALAERDRNAVGLLVTASEAQTPETLPKPEPKSMCNRPNE